MVVFKTAEGKSCYHQVDALDDAVRFVEHLRNNENIEQARVFRMAEVPLEVKPYFKVQIAQAEQARDPQAPVSPGPGEPDDEPAPPPAAVGSERGLGFFSRGH
jgi:hypothetical protein